MGELKELKGKCYLNETMSADRFRASDDAKERERFQDAKQRQDSRKQKAHQKSDAMSTHKTVLVFFVGGVTYSEISAIRMLEARPNTPWKFIVASTSIARGNDVINAFIDQDLKQ